MALVGTINSQNDFGFKNRLINAGFGIWQRGTSFTVAASTFTYTADRWGVYSGNSSTTVSRNTSVPTGQGFPYSAQVQRTATNTGTNAVFFEQIIESNNMLDLAGQTVTVSFWAKAGANFSSGSTGLYVNTGTTADQGNATSLGSWAGYTSAASYTFSPTTTWTKYTVSCTLSSSALELATLFYFNPSGTAGADDSLYITGVQLEKGSVATNFDFKTYGTELLLCQRYYHFLGGDTAYQNIVTGTYYGTADCVGPFRYPVEMRIAPTISKTGNWTALGGGGAAGQTVSADQKGTKNVQLGFTGGTSGTSGQSTTIRANNDTAFRITFDSEL